MSFTLTPITRAGLNGVCDVVESCDRAEVNFFQCISLLLIISLIRDNRPMWQMATIGDVDVYGSKG